MPPPLPISRGLSRSAQLVLTLVWLQAKLFCWRFNCTRHPNHCSDCAQVLSRRYVKFQTVSSGHAPRFHIGCSIGCVLSS